MTACSFAVSDHVCWNWAVRAARTAIPLFILGRTLSTCRSLDMRRLGSIRRPLCNGVRPVRPRVFKCRLEAFYTDKSPAGDCGGDLTCQGQESCGYAKCSRRVPRFRLIMAAGGNM